MIEMAKEKKMRKAIMIFFVVVFAANLTAQTPEILVQKCVDALGGPEAVLKSQDYQAKGEIKVSMYRMELVGKLETIQKERKYWRRAEVTFGSETYVQLQAYDGEVAWMDRMGTIVDQPALNSESDADHGFHLLIQEGSRFSFGKETEIEGRKAIGIEVDVNGKITTFFVDSETFLPLEMVYKDMYFGENFTKELLERRTRYSDYRNVEGVQFPMTVTLFQEGRKLVEMHYDEVTFRPQIALAKFQRPDQKLDLRYGEERIH